jgi:O6-methylguanine-DNA--protein-cysteine methyltransferase
MEENLTTQLSEKEKAELETLEGVITREMGSFVAVGKALLAIRDSKLYREQYKNFKEYCADKWGLSRQYSYDLIRGCQVAENLSAMADNFAPLVKIQPTNERQIRPLAILEPAKQYEVWEEAVRSADGKVVTYKQVKALVNELVGPAAPVTKKKDPHPESDALHFATIARSYLDKIRDDDPLREKALEEVRDWIIAKLKEPAVKKSS